MSDMLEKPRNLEVTLGAHEDWNRETVEIIGVDADGKGVREVFDVPRYTRWDRFWLWAFYLLPFVWWRRLLGRFGPKVVRSRASFSKVLEVRVGGATAAKAGVYEYDLPPAEPEMSSGYDDGGEDEDEACDPFEECGACGHQRRNHLFYEDECMDCDADETLADDDVCGAWTADAGDHPDRDG